MNELYPVINGLGFVGGIFGITAFLYAYLPRETVNVLRGIGELFGMKEEP